MSITQTALMQQRRDTAANWTSANPTLLAGEIGIESDTNKIKLGTGSASWTSLGYTPWSQVSAYPLVNADIASAAAIVDTKLATIATAGKVSNSATTAASANTASAIVARDASGNFTAGTITAALTGAASSNVLKAGDTMTGALVVPLASAATPSLTFTGNLNTGVFSPGANQVAVTTNGAARLTTSTTAVSSSLAIDHPLGAVGTPSITFTGDLNTGFYSPAADTLAAVTAGSNRLHITSGGLVGIGTSSPPAALTIVGSAGSGDAGINISSGSQTVGSKAALFFIPSINASVTTGSAIKSERLSPDGSDLQFFTVSTLGNTPVRAMTIDTSGRLLVGTSTTSYNGAPFQIVGSSEGMDVLRYGNDPASTNIVLYKTRGATNVHGIVSADDGLGQITFRGSDGTNYITGAHIKGEVDGTPGANDMPGRLVFSTTADGASSPTERLRITSTGQVRLAGAGITFNGDTATANELDDYEEGTWTASITGGTFTGLSNGRYTKIGRQVFLINNVNTSAITGNLQISGLPFVAGIRSADLSITVAPAGITYVPYFVDASIAYVNVVGTYAGSTVSTYFACTYIV